MTLTDDDGRYMWYTFEMECHGQKHLKHIEIASLVRKVQITEIELSNPLNETIKYEVSMLGEGLDGANEIALMPGDQCYKYELYFFPLRTFRSDAQVSFSNPRLGEIFYEVKLTAEEQPPVKLNIMKAELGKSVTRYIQ